MPKSKIFPSFADAVRDIPDGSVIGFGGFAVVGMPINLYQALTEQGAKGLTCVSNGTRGGSTMPSDAPTMEWLIRNNQVAKVICSFSAPTRASQKLALTEYYEKGLIEAELVPQGTLAERMRAAGAGSPAFYTRAVVLLAVPGRSTGRGCRSVVGAKRAWAALAGLLLPIRRT